MSIATASPGMTAVALEFLRRSIAQNDAAARGPWLHLWGFWVHEVEGWRCGSANPIRARVAALVGGGDWPADIEVLRPSARPDDQRWQTGMMFRFRVRARL